MSSCRVPGDGGATSCWTQGRNFQRCCAEKLEYECIKAFSAVVDSASAAGIGCEEYLADLAAKHLGCSAWTVPDAVHAKMLAKSVLERGGRCFEVQIFVKAGKSRLGSEQDCPYRPQRVRYGVCAPRGCGTVDVERHWEHFLGPDVASAVCGDGSVCAGASVREFVSVEDTQS